TPHKFLRPRPPFAARGKQLKIPGIIDKSRSHNTKQLLELACTEGVVVEVIGHARKRPSNKHFLGRAPQPYHSFKSVHGGTVKIRIRFTLQHGLPQGEHFAFCLVTCEGSAQRCYEGHALVFSRILAICRDSPVVQHLKEWLLQDHRLLQLCAKIKEIEY